MTYRNDLDAAHARIAALEAELGRKKNVPIVPPLPTVNTAPPEPRRAGRAHFHPPATWVPLLKIYAAALRGAIRPPRLSRIDTDSVASWIVQAALRPLFWLVALPLYYVALVVCAAWIGMWFVALTPVFVPIIAITRLRFSSRRPVETGWFHGDFDADTGRELLFMGTVMSAPTVMPLAFALGALLP